MDEITSLDQTKRQTINPLVDEINRRTEPILKDAAEEFGYTIPLAFRLYNQIRFYEEFGKLHLGVSVASKKTLSEQFGVTEQQIDDAFNNLTNKYKLGSWIDHDESVFRNVKRTWVSITRYKKGFSKYYGVIPNVLQCNTSSITAEYLGSEVPPLSESKKKVSESKNILRILDKSYGNSTINELFDYWKETTGLPITAKIKENRRACYNLLKKHTADGLKRLICGVAQAQNDQYAPRIADFCGLQAKTNELLLWGKKKLIGNKKGVIKV